ncbi:hypothetical protein HDR58_08300 [bacterium]|nr:hypothetical protein [bacterium]
MEIRNINGYSQSFGIKVPTKSVLEAACGMFLDDAKTSYPARLNLLSKLGNVDTNKLYSNQVVDSFNNLSKVIKRRYPEIADAAERITDYCKDINETRTFLPKDEIRINNLIKRKLSEEIRFIGSTEIDIAPISKKDLGLEYDRIT